MQQKWSDWSQMPIPTAIRKIEVPRSSGVYQLRNRATGELILFGISVNLRRRMKSLMPKPYGTGKRRNEMKRTYVLENHSDLEFRIQETSSRVAAVEIEHLLKVQKNHRFNT